MKERLALLMFVFLLVPVSAWGQLNDIQTSFEFTDLDGRFTIGQCYGCAVFENGLAKPTGNSDLVLNGENAWTIEPGNTGSIEFVAPVNRVRFFFKDENEAVGSLATLYGPSGEVIETFEGSTNGPAVKGFTQISLDGTLIKKITLLNRATQDDPVFVTVLEDLEASFYPEVITTEVDSFYLPRFADGTFSLEGKRNTFETEGILTNTGPFARVELNSFGDQGTPLAVTIEAPNRVTDSQFQFEMLKGEALSVTTVGSGDGTAAQNLILGYWQVAVRRVLSDVPSQGSVGATAVFKRSQEEDGIPVLLFETGIPAVRTLGDFSVSMDSTGDKDTGLAIVNPPATEGESTEDAKAQLILTVWDLKGEDQLARVGFELRAGEAVSKFIWEYVRDFGAGIDESVWNDLQEGLATVTVRSNRPVAPMTLRQNNPQAVFPEAVPSLTTFPVTAGAADSGITASK